jgi:hypothetical protein
MGSGVGAPTPCIMLHRFGPSLVRDISNSQSKDRFLFSQCARRNFNNRQTVICITEMSCKVILFEEFTYEDDDVLAVVL